MSDVPVYYMRDNHTFRRLSGNPETALAEIVEELDSGWTAGMLCAKRDNKSHIIHCNFLDVPAFIEKCRDALAAGFPPKDEDCSRLLDGGE